ncbi:MAG TPA: lipid-binding SYLF domain-containing protein [Candidatus Koribacter sp.]|jgi:lipid-binding SYLF domain-containing protein
MKKVLIAALSLALSGFAFGADQQAQVKERVDRAGAVLSEIMSTPDHGIPGNVLEHAKCIAIVPSMVSGGFVVGAKHGRGVATCRTENGWSAPAFFDVTGGSYGLQIGAEKTDLVMLIMNNNGMQHLLSSKFELGGEAGVAAGPVGRQGTAGTDWKMNAEVLTYSRSKGVFAGVDLSGASIKQDQDATQAFYGKDVTFREALTGQVQPPPAAHQFLSQIRQATSGEASAAAH